MAKDIKAVLGRVGRIMKSVAAGGAGRLEEGTKLVDMTTDQLLDHAQTEMARCETDPPALAAKRLRVLAKAIDIAKALNWESTTTAKVPVMNDTTTAMKDKTEREGSFTVPQPASTLFSENGAAEWTAKMQGRLAAVKEDVEEEEDPKSQRAEAQATGKAQWTRKYINELPDDAFLFIEKGAKKDGDGKSERAKRHFPVRDVTGKVDAAHATDAIGRIPQSTAPGLDTATKKDLQAKARKLLEAKKNLKKRGGAEGQFWPGDVVVGADAGGAWGRDDEEVTA